MLHELPITDIRLSACHENWHHMTPTERGRHCASCNREVVDFTQATAADLARARAAAPDGRLCGRFRASQLAPESRSKLWLRPKLRRFLFVAVLVVLQGFSARQAWAQRRPTPPTHSHDKLNRGPERIKAQETSSHEGLVTIGIVAGDVHKSNLIEGRPIYTMVEQMPEFPGGQAELLHFVSHNFHYPRGATRGGRIFIHVVVTNTGKIVRPQVIKSLDPATDAEALRVVQAMPAWVPGRQNGQPVDVFYTIPVFIDIRE